MAEERGPHQPPQSVPGSSSQNRKNVPQDSLVQITNTIADRVEPVMKIITTIAERSLKSKESESRFRTRMSLRAAIIILVAVGIAGWLT